MYTVCGAHCEVESNFSYRSMHTGVVSLNLCPVNFAKCVQKGALKGQQCHVSCSVHINPSEKTVLKSQFVPKMY